MTVRDILRSKGQSVITVTPDSTAHEAMRVLAAHNIGAAVVFDQEIRGILSERDLLRVGADDLQRLAQERVRDIMTPNVITAAPDADIREVMSIMTTHRIRHLPIVDGGTLQGIISIGDVVNALRSDVEAENRHLHAYIAGASA